MLSVIISGILIYLLIRLKGAIFITSHYDPTYYLPTVNYGVSY